LVRLIDGGSVQINDPTPFRQVMSVRTLHTTREILGLHSFRKRGEREEGRQTFIRNSTEAFPLCNSLFLCYNKQQFRPDRGEKKKRCGTMAFVTCLKKDRWTHLCIIHRCVHRSRIIHRYVHRSRSRSRSRSTGWGQLRPDRTGVFWGGQQFRCSVSDRRVAHTHTPSPYPRSSLTHALRSIGLLRNQTPGLVSVPARSFDYSVRGHLRSLRHRKIRPRGGPSPPSSGPHASSHQLSHGVTT
jgi:hypothetical protein